MHLGLLAADVVTLEFRHKVSDRSLEVDQSQLTSQISKATQYEQKGKNLA